MLNFNDCKRKLWVPAVLPVVLFVAATANAGADPNVVRTTTYFSPPLTFGVAADGMIFPDAPFIGREVVDVRITWDVVVADGHDANAIFADVGLPIITDSGNSVIILDGSTLGWSGSGTFNYYEATDRYNGFFGQAGTRWGWQAWGLPYDAVEVLPTSSIEIDYLVPCNYILMGDLDRNCRIDFVDFAIMAAGWLTDCITDPADPACIQKE